MPGEGSHRNRLVGESSPYLLLHQHNPVDWFPWGEQALDRARREDRPIFLSVGYSTCYWCHVMERESFSNPAIAELMNRWFVNIKVDREERPELDEIYMAATQLLTQHGGWPNSVFLTPRLKPFFAGTYFPPEDHRGLPGFSRVLDSLAEAWRSRREEVEKQADNVARALRHYLEERDAPAESPPDREVATAALEALSGRFDRRWGGFGGAPKFPTPSNLLLLEEFIAERPAAAEMLTTTLDRMARGGIYDHLAGGFHRYATDREWRIPHFEKMLYDNGLLLELYARQWERTGDPEMRRVVRETAAFMRREMTSPEGAFWSAIDAETEGREGAYYVWTQDELKEVLGEEDFGFLAPLYGLDVAPFFEGRFYVLHLPARLAEQALRRRTGFEELWSQIEPLRARLLERRSARPRPLTDEKILADWNGMVIAGMAFAGRVLGDRELVQRATAAAEFILEAMRPEGGPLCHTWRAGRGGIAAFLSDYAFLARGLLALHRADSDDRWLAAAIALTEEQEERLGDPRGGFFVAAERPDLLFRSKEVLDGAVPGANSIAALNLLELAARTGESRWAEAAERSLRAFARLVAQTPEAVKMMAVAARRFHQHQAQDSIPALVTTPSAGSAVASDKKVAAGLDLGAPRASGWRPFRLRLEIEPGWHVYAHAAAGEHLQPARLEGVGVALRGLEYPAGQTATLGSIGETVELYEQTVEVRGELRVEGDNAPFLKVSYQACDDSRCLAPAEQALAITD